MNKPGHRPQLTKHLLNSRAHILFVEENQVSAIGADELKGIIGGDDDCSMHQDAFPGAEPRKGNTWSGILSPFLPESWLT